MKKMLCLGLTLAMAASLTACGGSDTGSVSADAGDGGAGGVSGSITVWEHDYSFESSLEQIIEGFQKQYLLICTLASPPIRKLLSPPSPSCL